MMDFIGYSIRQDYADFYLQQLFTLETTTFLSVYVYNLFGTSWIYLLIFSLLLLVHHLMIPLVK